MNNRESYTHEEVKDMIDAIIEYRKACKSYSSYVLLGRMDLEEDKKSAKEKIQNCGNNLIRKLPLELFDKITSEDCFL